MKPDSEFVQELLDLQNKTFRAGALAMKVKIIEIFKSRTFASLETIQEVPIPTRQKTQEDLGII